MPEKERDPSKDAILIAEQVYKPQAACGRSQINKSEQGRIPCFKTGCITFHMGMPKGFINVFYFRFVVIR